jgi:MtaA/CmuA family methyltransferase
MRDLVFPINALPACGLVPGGIEGVVRDPAVKLEAVRRYYQAVDADVLFYVSDIVIQAEAMGADVFHAPGAMPAVRAPANVVRMPVPARVERMAANAEVLRGLARDFPTKLRAGLVYGPFTVAGQVAGEETLLRMLVDRPREVAELLERTLECARRYADLLVDNGANLVWVSDPLAALIPPDDFERFAGGHLRRFFEAYPSLPTILHVCGDTTAVVPAMAATGVGGLSLDNCMDLLAVEDLVPGNVAIIGNLDPVEVVELGSLDMVAGRTVDLVSLMAVKDNFCLSTGCALPPSTPLENVQAFVDTGRRRLAELTPHRARLAAIGDAVHASLAEEVGRLVREAREAGVPPLEIIGSGLTRAIRKGSAEYDAGKCHLPALLLMVDAFYKGFRLLESELGLAGSGKADIILGTVKGDIHEIGKNLVRIFLETHGHGVLDLGVNVSGERFLKAYAAARPALVGLSAFTTSSKRQLGGIIRAFRDKGIDVPIMIGGAAVNAEVARSVGADGFARDAVKAVELAERLMRGQTWRNPAS